MKKEFSIPEMSISKFVTENIITTSGAGDNAKNMKEKMSDSGYSVTTKTLEDFIFAE